jgi:hypothetical protein
VIAGIMSPPFPLVALRVRFGVCVGRWPDGEVEAVATAGAFDWMRSLARAELQRRRGLS